MSEDTIEGLCEVCKKRSSTKCSLCRLVYYCSAEHQKDNWKLHKDLCKPYEITQSNEMGRFVRALRDLDVGDIIKTDSPLIFGPKHHISDDVHALCVGCCKRLNSNILIQCPDCLWPVCSLTCEGLKVPKRHGFECQILKLRPPCPTSNFKDYYRYDVLIILRALALQKLNKQKWDSVIKLEDHMSKRGPKSEIFKIIQEKADFLQNNYLKPLKAYELETNQSIIPDVSNGIIHRIYGILDVNVFEANEDDIEADILYPLGSMIEHNCVPNVIQTFDHNEDNKVTIRAAISIKKGDHIMASYTNILWGTQERREHLKEVKYFNCLCDRCKDPTEFGTYLSALKCIGTETEPCGGTQLPDNPVGDQPKWTCNKCGIQLPNEDIIKFVGHLSAEVDKEMAKKPKVEELEEFLQKLLNFLHPNHYLVYTIKHSLVQLYGNDSDVEISNEYLAEKVKMCKELIDVTRKIDPGNARLSIYLAVLLNELFKARFTFLTRSFDPNNKASSSELINDILNILKENKTVLLYDLHSTTGKQLNDIVALNDIKFKKWLEENNILSI